MCDLLPTISSLVTVELGHSIESVLQTEPEMMGTKKIKREREYEETETPVEEEEDMSQDIEAMYYKLKELMMAKLTESGSSSLQRLQFYNKEGIKLTEEEKKAFKISLNLMELDVTDLLESRVLRQTCSVCKRFMMWSRPSLRSSSARWRTSNTRSRIMW